MRNKHWIHTIKFSCITAIRINYLEGSCKTFEIGSYSSTILRTLSAAAQRRRLKRRTPSVALRPAREALKNVSKIWGTHHLRYNFSLCGAKNHSGWHRVFLLDCIEVWPFFRTSLIWYNHCNKNHPRHHRLQRRKSGIRHGFLQSIFSWWGGQAGKKWQTGIGSHRQNRARFLPPIKP